MSDEILLEDGGELLLESEDSVLLEGTAPESPELNVRTIKSKVFGAVRDIRISWNLDYMEGDFVFDSFLQDYESDEGIETSVIISLFTDRRAGNDDILPDLSNPDKRGWWGDLVSPTVEGDQIGSRLWLLSREKVLKTVLQRAKKYATEAVQWMIDDAIASKIDVNVEAQLSNNNTHILAIQVLVYKPDGNIVPLQYDLQWASQSLR